MVQDDYMLSSLQVPAETLAVSLPGSVERAIQIPFNFPVSGYLCCARVDTHIRCLIGVVYRESRSRFRDGATIRTSTLCGRLESHGYHVFETRNGSRYLVCDWAQGGGSPEFSGVRH